VQPRSVRQLRIDERGGQVQTPPGQPQHPFDQVRDLFSGEDDCCEFGSAAAGDEHPTGLVDPVLRTTKAYLVEMRAAIYTRISRDELGDGLGVRRQETDCREVCKRQSWRVVDTYVDNDVSAFSGKTRPAYQRLVADVKAGHIDAVVAWAPERLHRSPRELEDFLELIERAGTAVQTVKAGAWDVTTSHGRLVARMLGAVSRAESERTGERVSRAHRQAQENGFWRGPVPFGMRSTSAPGKPEPDPESADIVREIFERVLRGDALTRIASTLNADGVRPRRGEAWTHTGISRLIASPALGGLVSSNGELQHAVFDGVVSPEKWRAAGASLQRRPRGEARRPRETLTLLGGILLCQDHGHRCVGTSAAHAATYSSSVVGVCSVSITRAAADDLVQRLVVGRLGMKDARSLLTIEPDQADFEAQAREIHDRREQLAALVAEGLIGAIAVRQQLEILKDRLTRLEAARSPYLIPASAFHDPTASWNSWTMPQRREIVRLLFHRLALRPAGVKHGPKADARRITVAWAAPY
jgi:site-specific DNA recombinase